ALGAEPAALDTRLLAGRGLRVVGSCAFAPGTFAAAVDHLVAGRVVAGTLVSERLQLAAASDALVRLRSPGDLVRVLVQPWR
ncbi:MAG: hypothetical protein ACRDYD_11105, partial [Acidimicrobiales bacterium]